MKRFFSGPLLALLFTNLSFSQSTPTPLSSSSNGGFYLTWGYHRNGYTKSTLHLRDHASDNYDFTLSHAKAKDQPDMHELWKTPLTVPQYVFRMGYYFKNKNHGIELSWDHLKYVVIDNQLMHLKGTIHDVYYDKDTLVTPDFVHVEHTNGNNYAMVSWIGRHSLLKWRSGEPRISAVYTAGAGVLIPKTDSRVLGNHNDGPFRYSGIVVGASAGLRYHIVKYLYVEGSVKGAFADYTNAKVYLQGRVRHHFFSVQYVGAIGVNIPL